METNTHFNSMKTMVMSRYTFVLLLVAALPVVGQIVPPVTIRSSTNPTPGLLYLAPNNRIPTPPFAPSLMVVGNDGKVVTSKVLKTYAYDFRTLPDGRLGYTLNRPNTAETPGSSVIYITDTTLKTLDSIPLAPRGYSLAMDGFVVLPNGNRLILSQENVTLDMRKIAGEGAHPAAIVQQSVLQEIDIDGQVLFQWKSLDHIPVTASYEDLKAPFIRYFHINSIDVEPDGNILISARNASLVAKIHRSTGKVLWILGGKLNQFTLENTVAPSEPAEFSYQHDVRRSANGNITLFDNGNMRSPQWSRAVEYQLDEAKKTSRLVWRYRPTTDLFSVTQGSCQTLTNGNKLISWGSAVSNNRTLLTEVTASGETVFEAELPNSMIPYKAERVQSPAGRYAADVLIDEILPTNTYTYTRGKDTVGVSITYHTLISFFYNTTTARRFMWSPENPRFVAGKDKNTSSVFPPRTIYRSRMTITQEGMESHGAEFRFKAELFGVTDPANTVVYYRPVIGTGSFYPLPTRYNPNTKELVVDTSEVGEFCFGSPLMSQPDTLETPRLLSPVNGEEVSSTPTYVVSPQGKHTHITFYVPNSSGRTTVESKQDRIAPSDTLPYGTYRWNARSEYRVENPDLKGVSQQADSATFIVRAPFIEIDSSTVPQTWRRGRSYPISWRSNLSGTLRIELVKNETTLIAENVQASTRGFLWAVPQTVPVGSEYSIRIRHDGSVVEDVTEKNITIEEASSIDSDEAVDIHLAPNPASDQLYIGGSKELSRIMVFNTSGAMVASYAVTGTGTSIDTSLLPQGSYVMVLQGAGVSATKQLQIVR